MSVIGSVFLALAPALAVRAKSRREELESEVERLKEENAQLLSERDRLRQNWLEAKQAIFWGISRQQPQMAQEYQQLAQQAQAGQHQQMLAQGPLLAQAQATLCNCVPGRHQLFVRHERT